MYGRVLYLFLRDLRIKDNNAFYDAVKNSRELIPLFIFEEKEYNPFQRKFLISALFLLNLELEKLKSLLYVVNSYFSYETLNFIYERIKPEAIYLNKDFTWKFEEKEKLLEDFCRKKGIVLRFYDGNFLVNPMLIDKRKVFTPFYKKWVNYLDVKDYNERENIPFINTPLVEITKFRNLEILKEADLKIINSGFNRLKKFDFEAYDKNRDFLSIDGTSKLSPFINFGVISIKEVYKKIKNIYKSQFLKELAFREFWYHIRLNFPETRNIEFQEKKRKISWPNNDYFIEKFKKGETGYPIIDACIRQLISEGWINNRARMLLASFLTKTLLTDWRIGEKFFKDYLVDYDEVLNIQNWQWSASVGADPRPLRIFNPILQSQRYDSECIFIKKYIPELKNEECYKIHNPLKYKISYVEPIVNFYIQRDMARNLYKKM
ncbi:MAG: deoxyribodipyrimidine photo-lyase [Dictyoglomaceae bacterium]